MSFVSVVGCGPEEEAPEAAAIRDVFNRHERAAIDMDGNAGLATLTADSIAYYDALVDYAMNADKDTVFRLAPIDKMEIVRIRNRIEPDELRNMSGRDVLYRAFEDGWYSFDPDEYLPITLGKIDVAGDYAAAMILEDDEKTGHFVDFYLEDGAWKLDFQSWDTLWNKRVEEVAREAMREEGMSMEEMILYFESYDYGYIRTEVDRWKPVKDW